MWTPTRGGASVTPYHEGGIGDLAISPDGKTIVTAGHDKTARLWDVATGRPIGAALKHRGAVFAAAFSPDGKGVLTAGDDGLARLWAITPDEAARLPLPEADPGYPVGRSVSRGGLPPGWPDPRDGTLRRRATVEGDLMSASRRTPEAPVGLSSDLTVVFSPDGRAVLTIQGDESRVWDAFTGRPISPPCPCRSPSEYDGESASDMTGLITAAILA